MNRLHPRVPVRFGIPRSRVAGIGRLLQLGAIGVAVLLVPRLALAASVNADFNCDGFDDLAVGVSFEDIGSLSNAGGVNVIYGGPFGLNAGSNQFWYQGSPGVLGKTEEYDRFGSELVADDFNQDLCDDLVISVEHEEVNGAPVAGAVHVLYGSFPDGLTSAGDQLWHQDAGLQGVAEPYDHFGSSLATGDFDCDGHTDLAVGAAVENNVGAVHVIFGSSSGLTATADDLLFHSDLECSTVDSVDTLYFGAYLAAIDGDGDGCHDLAIPTALGGGQSHRLYFVGIENGSCVEKLTSTRAFDVSSGDFNGDGLMDLVAGFPDETVSGHARAGAVRVYEGIGPGSYSQATFLHQNAGLQGVAELLDFFGSEVVVGDFNGDGTDDLAVGVPSEDYAHDGDRIVHEIFGQLGVGLTTAGDRLWHADVTGVQGAQEPNSAFGVALGSGDYDGDGFADLAIGHSVDGGSVHVLYGSESGLSAQQDDLWSQDSPGIFGLREPGDYFGNEL